MNMEISHEQNSHLANPHRMAELPCEQLQVQQLSNDGLARALNSPEQHESKKIQFGIKTKRVYYFAIATLLTPTCAPAGLLVSLGPHCLENYLRPHDTLRELHFFFLEIQKSAPFAT